MNSCTDKPLKSEGAGRRYVGRLLASAAVVAVMSGLPIQSAQADEFSNGIDDLMDEFSDLVAVSEGELAKHRGGMKVGLVDVSFTVNVRTTIENPNIAGSGTTIIETGFALGNTPGQFTNLGTQIRNETQQQVQETLQNAGITSPVPADPAPSVQAITPAVNTVVSSAGASQGANQPANPAPAPVNTALPQVASTSNTPTLTPAPKPAPAPAPSNPVVDTIVAATEIVEGTVTELPAQIAPYVPASETPSEQGGGSNNLAVASNSPAGPTTTAAPSVATSNIDVAVGSEVVSSDTGTAILSTPEGSSVLATTQQGHMTLIQNTANDVIISSRIIANYNINNYGAIATRASGVAQINNLSRQLLVLGTLGLD